MDLIDYRRKIIANSPHLKSASGSIVSFSDGADLPLKSLNVGIEPVQDLHGYDSPWVGGGGKNLLPPFSGFTNNGLTTTANSDGSITVTGTATGSGGYITDYVSLARTVSSGTTVAISVKNNVPSKLRIFPDSGTADISANSNSTVYTPSADMTKMRLYLFTTSGTSYNFTIYPMLEIGNSATDYAPYENICPISGWNGVKVTRVEVNLWDEQWEIGSYNAGTSTVQKYTDTTHIRSKNPISVKPNTTYYFMSASKNVHLIVADANGNVLYRSISLNNGTFTTPSNGTFVYFNMAAAYGTTYNHDISINYPATDHSYHPYNGVNVSIDLGQTVYGGTLNTLTGVMTADRAMVDLGTLTWTKRTDSIGVYFVATKPTGEVAPESPAHTSMPFDGICSIYQVSASNDVFDGSIAMGAVNSTAIYVRDSRYTDASAFTTAVQGAQLCYKLKTPQTVQLTPQQIRSLYGNNTIFADTGNTSLEYWAHP